MNETELEFLTPLLKDCTSNIAVDVGCHKGEFSRELIARGFQVIGLEPNCNDPELQAALYEVPELELYSLAASNVDGHATMHIGEHVATNSLEDHWVSTAFPDNFIRRNDKLEVPTVRLDTFFGDLGIGSVGMLKIDAEGHDLKVIRGLGSFKPEIIMFEAHHKFPGDYVSALELLKSTGYEHFKFFVHHSNGQVLKCGGFTPNMHEECFINVVAY